MRTASVIALVAAGVFAAGCSSSRTARSLVARNSSSYGSPTVVRYDAYRAPSASRSVTRTRTYAAPSAAKPAVRSTTHALVSPPPPPPPPSMTRSYARAPVRSATPVRRATPAPLRTAAPSAPSVVRRPTTVRHAPQAASFPDLATGGCAGGT